MYIFLNANGLCTSGRCRVYRIYSLPNSYHLATMQMIHSNLVAPGPDYVRLNWTHPKFHPERYQLKYVCTMNPACSPTNDTNQYIATKTANLSSDTTSVTISDIRPSSFCMLFLLAVYNPASIDTGIMITGTSLDEDAREINPGLLYFIMPLIIYCLYFPLYVCACVREYILCKLSTLALYITKNIIDVSSNGYIVNMVYIVYRQEAYA